MTGPELAAQLEAGRRARGWSIRRLSAAAGVDRAPILRIQAGAGLEVAPYVLARLALALGEDWHALGAALRLPEARTARQLVIARLRRGWSANQLATRAGLAPHVIRRLEARGSGDRAEWGAVAAALDVPPAQFL